MSTCSNYLCLAIAGFLYLGQGMNLSLLAPFFPNEAMGKSNLTLQMVSIVMTAFEASNLIAIVLLSYVTTPSNQRTLFCSGALISSTCCVLFGYVPQMGMFEGNYVIIGFIVVQVVQGIGSSMVLNTGNPIFVGLFSGKESRVTSLLESTMGIGILAGPALGSILYSIGGFKLPFTSVGSVQFLASLMCTVTMIVMQPKKEKEQIIYIEGKDDWNGRNCSIKSFLQTSSILCVLLPTFILAAASGCISVTLAPFLLDQFLIGSDHCGFYFLAFGVTYSAGAILVGFLGDKGYSFHMPLVSLPIASVGYAGISCMLFTHSLLSRYTVILLLSVEG